jgi:hypothetical protein
VATLWCPQCGSEYREGLAVCADCGAALVAEAPSTAADVTDVPHAPFDAADDVVELARVPSFDAEVVAMRLRGSGIPTAVFGVGTAGVLSALQLVHGSRLMVRRGDLDAARVVMSELFGGEVSAPIDDAELSSLADAAAGYSDPETGAVV